MLLMSPFYLLCFSNVFKHESLSTAPAASIWGHVFFQHDFATFDFSISLNAEIPQHSGDLVVCLPDKFLFVFLLGGYFFFIYSFPLCSPISLSFFPFHFPVFSHYLYSCFLYIRFFFFYLFFFVSTFCPFSILKKKKISFPILPTKLGPETGDTRSPRSYIHEIVSLQEVSNATAQNVPTKKFCLNSCIFAIFKNKMNRFRFLSSSKRVNNYQENLS